MQNNKIDAVCRDASNGTTIHVVPHMVIYGRVMVLHNNRNDAVCRFAPVYDVVQRMVTYGRVMRLSALKLLLCITQ